MQGNGPKLATDLLVAGDDLSARLDRVFGSNDDPMHDVAKRAAAMLPEMKTIVWEGDPQTFQFTYVSEPAEELLGYACSRWTTEPTFWADTVVHADDRNDAIAYCALATGQCRDHDFRYRARSADGRTLLLHDVVRVVLGSRGVPERLRGVMIALGEVDRE